MRTLILGVLILSAIGCADSWRDTATSAVPVEACPPVELAGDPAVPTSIVLSNGRARVTFPGDDGRGEMGSHRLEVWAADGWRYANDERYRDWTFYASPWNAGTAHTAHVIRDDHEEAIVSFEFDHPLNRPRPGGCYLAGCGVPYRDPSGNVFYDYNRPGMPRLGHVRFWKTIGLQRCATGYLVNYATDPPLAWGSWNERRLRENSLGERELGLGFIAGVTWSSAGVVARSPEGGPGIVDLGILEQAAGPWWFATVPAPSSEGLRVIAFASLEHPMESFHVQWSPGERATPMVHQMVSQLGADGRPEPWMVFIGAVPYVSPDLAAEPTPTARALVLAALPIWH